jgi:hypothetical protein
MREDELDEMKSCTPNHRVCVYSSFLLLPIITLVLLQYTPWHENNSECDPHTKRLVLVSTSTRSDTDAMRSLTAQAIGGAIIGAKDLVIDMVLRRSCDIVSNRTWLVNY